MSYQPPRYRQRQFSVEAVLEETVQTASGETVMERVSKHGMQRVECL